MDNRTTTIFLWLSLLVVSASALTIDTTLTGNGSPGPYPLGIFYVDTATLVVSFDDTLRLVSPYIYLDDVNGLLFSDPIDNGTAIRVRYRTMFQGLHKRYFLFERTVLDTSDSALPFSPLSGSGLGRDDAGSSLSLTGYKSVGVSLGSQGQMNLEQALEVRVFGNVGPQTELSANISDQGTSLEGATREIGELDMVYVALNNPRYNVTVGDQFVSLPAGGMLQGSKKIKGLSVNYTGIHLRAGAFGAVSGGKQTVQTIYGQFGFQGPYYLTGSGEADYISPIGGTVRVRVQGRELEEGEDRDYVVDYEQATVTFTPRFAIRDDHLIRVEYEYKSFDYQRASFGTDIGIASVDSVVTARGVLWYEADNKESPIDLPVDLDVARAVLLGAGDSPPLVPNGRRVHPNDIDEYRSLGPLYRVERGPDGAAVYVYEPDPVVGEELYNVWFRPVAPGQGEYVRTTDTTEDGRAMFVHRYDSTGRGDYSARSPVSSPERTVIGEVRASVKPLEWLETNLDIAAQEHDRNLFSDIDDGDNTGVASRSGLRIGLKTREKPALWLEGAHTFVSPRFDREVVSLYDRRALWDREFGSIAGSRLNLWDATVGGTVMEGVGADASYGQFILDGSVLTRRLGNTVTLSRLGPFSGDYRGRLFLHGDSGVQRRRHRNGARLGLDFNRLSLGIPFEEEWERSDTSVVQRGSAGGGLDLHFVPLSLTESVYYSRRMRGTTGILEGLFGGRRLPPDTANTFSWTQSIRHSPSSVWTLSSTSTYQWLSMVRDTARDLTATSLLVTATSDVASPRTGITTRQHLRVSTERATAFVLIPDYAGGPGLGDYSLDPVTGIPEPDAEGGDYFAYEREIYDTTGGRSRKALVEWDWGFRPPAGTLPGILADITWTGDLSLEEHVVSDGTEPASHWIPGYVTLNANSRDDSLLTFADISYRQDADWRPDSLAGLRAGVHVEPGMRRVRGYVEHELEWGGKLDRTWDRWFLGADGRVLTVEREGLVGYRDTFEVVDRYVDFTERFEIRAPFSLFCHEVIGWASRTARRDTTFGNYYMIRPGISFQPRGKGMAEVSYTYADVRLDGPIDYRMARGRDGGRSHLVEAFANINAGDHFTVSGTWRTEFIRTQGAARHGEGVHTVSVEVKAYL